MNTNFFGMIAQLNITGDLQIIISKGAENSLAVPTMLQNGQCGDKAKELIPPFNLRGTAQELDEGYFGKITQPVETASGLMDNMEAFMKQLEVARQQSAMVKDKADKEKKAKEEKKKKYDEAMKKVAELEKEGKYREAWVKIPDPLQYPEQAEEIDRRRAALGGKFAPDLFDTPAPQPQQEEPVTDNPEEVLINDFDGDCGNDDEYNEDND